jgi:16S rRNA (cytosine1402-N4)-methyltransferase
VIAPELLPNTRKPRRTSRNPTRSMTASNRNYEYHESVLRAEVVKFLALAPGGMIVDGTLGGGGHSAALLAAGARVIALDQDPEALKFASSHLGDGGHDFRPVRANFADVASVLDTLEIGQIDGALLDLGVSSHQLDTAGRGFSFMRDGPLDMRMDPSAPVSAADFVNGQSGEQLESLFRNLGEEPAARKIAARLMRDRLVTPFATTKQLADAVEAVVPRRGHTHPATRVFQALRIAVNRELEVLAEGLAAFSARLAPGGRLAVITFHSLEDRIVKQFFKARTVEFLDRPEWPAPRPNPDFIFRAVTRKPVTASEAEQRANPRARSAKLRVVERISHGR